MASFFTTFKHLYHSKWLMVLQLKKRPKVLIIDDSAYDRNRSKKVELLARCFDHASLKMRYYKGFRMLTLGWSDGYTFMPIDFSLLSSKKAQINGISTQIDKRTCGYKRRENTLQSSLDQIPDMIKRAVASGVDSSYVLMDTWFTMPPLIKAIVEQGLDVIGMVKETKQRYLVGGKLVSLKQLYHLAQPVQSKKGILRSIHTETANGTLNKNCIHSKQKQEKRVACHPQYRLHPFGTRNCPNIWDALGYRGVL